MAEQAWTFRLLNKDQDFEVIKAQSRWFGFGRPYEFVLTLAGDVLDLDEAKEGYLEWSNIHGQPMRAYGWIRKINTLSIQHKRAFYQMILSSPLLALNQRENTQIFLEQRPTDLMHLLTQSTPQSFWRFSSQLKKSYSQEPFLLQYQKSDFEFIQTLCARFGFWYDERFEYPTNQCFLRDQLDLDASHAQSIPWVELSGLARDSGTVFDFQYQQNRDTAPTIRAKIDDPGLSVGQLIQLKNHPVGAWNNIYRIIRMQHHFGSTAKTMRYWNHCDLLPLHEHVVAPQSRKKRTLLLPAHIEAPDASTPFLDDQGRYKVKWKCDDASRPVGANSPFIVRLQDYGSTEYHSPFGVHFPLRHGTEVAMSFLENNLEKPIILGALSHPFCPNVVSAENASQYRIRTYGGNEMVWEDSPSNEYVHWHTAREEQEFKLQAGHPNSYIRMANRTGDLHIEAQKNLQVLVQQNALSKVQNNYMLTVGGQTIELVYGSQWLNAGTDIQVQTSQELKWSVTGPHLKIQSQQATYQAQNFIHFLSQKGHLSIQAKTISGQAQTIHIYSQGKIDLGGAIQVTSDGVSGSATLCAPSITCKPAAGGGGGVRTVGEALEEKKEKSIPKEAPKVFDLIALNLREDVNDAYFQCTKSKNKSDPYKKDRLSSSELGYFVQQDNNAVIFIHGYNVGYGEFGEKIQTNDVERLNKGVFKRTDICRLIENVNKEFPDYGESLLKIPVKKNSDTYEWSMPNQKDPEEKLNGTDAHNWWLNMEWNLNCATQQFDPQNFDHYMRLCHIAWQGDPSSSLDYMAAEGMADRVVPKAVAAIQPLINQGIKVNIIAHSLGCRVLLGVMEQLGKNAKGSKKPPLQHVFLWQPAVPDDAFTNEFPNVYLAAKKITVLYSEHDNVLGPVPSHENGDFWKKATDKNTGFLLACVAGVIHRIDQKFRCDIESPYRFAKMMKYPMTQLLKETGTRESFYREWIQTHVKKNPLGKDKRWSSDLREQMTYHSLLHPVPYEFLVRLFDCLQLKQHKIALDLSHDWHLGKDSIYSHFSQKMKNMKGGSLYSYLTKAFKKYEKPCQEMAAIVLTVLTSEPMDEKYKIRPAMGYAGPDMNANHDFLKRLYEKKKLKLVDQKDILIEHSSMKIPNEEMKHKVYEIHICGSEGLSQFGHYVYDTKLKSYCLKKGGKK